MVTGNSPIPGAPRNSAGALVLVKAKPSTIEISYQEYEALMMQRELAASYKRQTILLEEMLELAKKVSIGTRIAGQGFPMMVLGKAVCFCSKEALAEVFAVSTNTIDRLVEEGILPRPCTDKAKTGAGKRLLRWDVYECISRFLAHRG